MPLDFLHNVFLLYLAFEAAQRTFKSFALLQMDFCQLEIHHLPVNLQFTAKRSMLPGRAAIARICGSTERTH